MTDDITTLPALNGLAEMNETARILNEAFAKLPPHMREILQARAAGESFESIAERQGATKQAAQQRASPSQEVAGRSAP